MEGDEYRLDFGWRRMDILRSEHGKQKRSDFLIFLEFLLNVLEGDKYSLDFGLYWMDILRSEHGEKLWQKF